MSDWAQKKAKSTHSGGTPLFSLKGKNFGVHVSTICSQRERLPLAIRKSVKIYAMPPSAHTLSTICCEVYKMCVEDSCPRRVSLANDKLWLSSGVTPDHIVYLCPSSLANLHGIFIHLYYGAVCGGLIGNKERQAIELLPD